MFGSLARLRRWRKVLRHVRGPAEAFLVARVVLFAALVPALMRLKLTRLELLLEPRRTPRRADASEAEKVLALVDAVLAAGRPLVRRGCLTRGVTRYYFLRRAGVPVELRFGMGKPQGEFVGHCWLVKDGEPYRERRDPRPLYAAMHTVGRSDTGSLRQQSLDRIPKASR
jgi:hypothetical protein